MSFANIQFVSQGYHSTLTCQMQVEIHAGNLLRGTGLLQAPAFFAPNGDGSGHGSVNERQQFLLVLVQRPLQRQVIGRMV